MNDDNKMDVKPPGVGRRNWLWGGACVLVMAACSRRSSIYLFDVVLFNYLDRPIFEVLINGGVDANSTPYPSTGGATIADVALRLGPQVVTWRLDGPEGLVDNGKTITSKNAPILEPISNGRYLGVHIYPDSTVELIPTVHYPGPSKRGEADMLRAGRGRTRAY